MIVWIWLLFCVTCIFPRDTFQFYVHFILIFSFLYHGLSYLLKNAELSSYWLVYKNLVSNFFLIWLFIMLSIGYPSGYLYYYYKEEIYT